MKRLEPFVLRGKATFARGVDHEQDLPREIGKRLFLPFECRGGKIMDRAHCRLQIAPNPRAAYELPAGRPAPSPTINESARRGHEIP